MAETDTDALLRADSTGSPVTTASGRYSLIDWAQITVAACAVVGMFFTAIQFAYFHRALDRSDRQNNLAAWATISQQELAIDDLFIEHPELQKYFYGGAIAQKSEADRVHALATKMVDFFENVEDVAIYVPIDNTTAAGLTIGQAKAGMSDRKTWENYMVNTFRTSPAMCAVVKERGDEYDSGLKRLAHQGCNPLNPRPSSPR